MSEGEHQDHLSDKLQRHDKYTEAKERLTKLVEQFDFELTEFRNTWVDKSDVKDATKEIVSRMCDNIKRAADELDPADEKRKGEQRECTPVSEVELDNEGLPNAIHRKEAPHTKMISPSRSELRSVLIEVVGDWDKCLHVRYHNGGHVKIYSPAPHPPVNRKNKSDETLRGRLLKARVVARNSHPNGETKTCNGPAPSPKYQWTRRYGTPPPRFAELDDNQDEPDQGYCSNVNTDRKRELEDEDSDENYDSYESDDEGDDESRNKNLKVGDEVSHQDPSAKRSREDPNGDELGEEKEESLQPRLKKPRMV